MSKKVVQAEGIVILNRNLNLLKEMKNAQNGMQD